MSPTAHAPPSAHVTPAACLPAETVGSGDGVLVGVVAHPVMSPAISSPRVKVMVVRGESFNRLP